MHGASATAVRAFVAQRGAMRARFFACAAAALAIAGCVGTYPHELDPRRNLVQIIWSDGKAASLVSCTEPSSCDMRVSALCRKRFERLAIDAPAGPGMNWVVLFRCR